MSAFDYGRQAGARGRPIQNCPFDTDTPEFREWRLGWSLSQVKVTWTAYDYNGRR